ncbi:MAG TPA: hypothetical protein V6D50_21195 [Chroococcales cyanobacterium]
MGLAAQLCKALNAAGHQTLTATVGATPRLEVWSKPVSDDKAENFLSQPQPTTSNQTPTYRAIRSVLPAWNTTG